MKACTVLACLFVIQVVVSASPIGDSEWTVWKQNYNRHYEDDSTELQRYAVWKSNLALISAHNQKADIHGYTLGMNEYTDLTDAEFDKLFNGYLSPNTTKFTSPAHSESMDSVRVSTLPVKVDWREAGAVTAVMNQKGCNACWAFSATGSLEGQHFLKEKTLVSLSEQNLIDCSKLDGNNGCQKGNMINAFSYIKRNNGVDTEESYPYQAKDGFCRFQRSAVGANLSGYEKIQSGNVTALTVAVAEIGPISVGMDASLSTFRHYNGSVYSDARCSSIKLNHAVLVVGYGTTATGTDYFVVKNSYGQSWGIKGYAMIARGSNNLCGLATRASYPIV